MDAHTPHQNSDSRHQNSDSRHHDSDSGHHDAGSGGTVLRLRPLTSDDGELLRRATLEAVNWAGEGFTDADLDAADDLAHYLQLGPEDFGVVAETDQGNPAGVVWCQYADAGSGGYGFVSASVPELSIAVLPEFRGRGLGRVLLDAATDEATDRDCPGLSLSVEAGNWAQQFYRRSGFVTVGLNGNSDTMLRDLQAPPRADDGTEPLSGPSEEPLEGEVF